MNATIGQMQKLGAERETKKLMHLVGTAHLTLTLEGGFEQLSPNLEIIRRGDCLLTDYFTLSRAYLIFDEVSQFLKLVDSFSAFELH